MKEATKFNCNQQRCQNILTTTGGTDVWGGASDLWGAGSESQRDPAEFNHQLYSNADVVITVDICSNFTERL